VLALSTSTLPSFAFHACLRSCTARLKSKEENSSAKFRCARAMLVMESATATVTGVRGGKVR
jgi:hypothetical protein